jgi:hypothetical protein
LGATIPCPAIGIAYFYDCQKQGIPEIFKTLQRSIDIQNCVQQRRHHVDNTSHTGDDTSAGETWRMHPEMLRQVMNTYPGISAEFQGMLYHC